nr:MAG TPA: hypothetical protein [Caudoviricetes sp.]
MKCPVRRWQLVRAVPPVSILTVVVNELDGGVKAHHGDECMQGKHLPPLTKPTAWDHSAREPTLPYPHLPGLSPGFLFQAPGTIIDTPTC